MDDTAGPPHVCAALSWDGGTSLTSHLQAALTATGTTTYNLGGAVSTWTGHTSWTTTEINDTNFRVRTRNYSTSGSTARDYSLDWIPVTVVYTAPWDSYSDSGHTTVSDSFSSAPNTVYMRGTGFPTATYRVAFYDATVSGGGNKIAESTGLSPSGGNLDAQIITSDFPGSVAGTWKAVASTSGSTLPSTYNAIVQDTDHVVGEDRFSVGAGAIPEFPTIVGGLLASLVGAGAYLWMRRREPAGRLITR